MHCRGGAYIAVLGAAVLVTIIGLGAIAAVRVQSQAARTTADLAQARRHARSAIELARQWIADSPDTWRSDAAANTGKWGSELVLAGGTIHVRATDPIDEDLTDDPNDPVVLTGTGKLGRARQRLAVRLAPAYRYPALEAGMVSADTLGDAFTIEAAKLVSDRLIHAAGDLAVNDGGELWADAEAGDEVAVEQPSLFSPGGKLYGEGESGAALRKLPDPTQFVNEYVSRGTQIPLESLPPEDDSLISAYTLRDVALTPTHNPYGPVNDKGVYWIDCSLDEIIIENCRIVGTLVLLDPDNDSVVRGAVSWRPAIANYPALVTEEEITIKTDRTMVLSERPSSGSGSGVNLNPDEDDDFQDGYPSVIRGMIYSADKLNLDGKPRIVGPVLAEDAIEVLGGAIELRHRGRYANSPPPGWIDGQPRIEPVADSWRRVVD